VQGIEFLYRSEQEAMRLAETRMDDDLLEQAIRHRDLMRSCKRESQSRSALASMVSQFSQIGVAPTLRPLVGAAQITSLIKRFVDSCSGYPSAIADATSRRVLLENLQAAAAAYETLVKVNVRSAAEAFALAALTDLCRSVVQLCCCSVTTEDPKPREYGNSAVLSNTAAAMESLLAANVVALRGTPRGQQHLQTILNILDLARYSIYHRTPEDVRAGVALLMAELLSVCDRLLPPSVVLAPVDRTRRAKGAGCALTGMRLTNQEELKSGVCELARKYWCSTIGQELPRAE
jgi:hypothetical protein